MKTRMWVGVVLLLGGALAQTAFEGAWEGDWEGVIGPDSLNLSVIVHFEAGQDGLTGTVDIPTQGSRGLALDVQASADTATFTIEGVPGDPTFEGELTDDDLILGTFTQSGQSLPFRLERRVAVPEAPPVVEAFLGSWQGVIGPDTLALEVGVTFEEVDGTFAGRITIPAQSFEGLLSVRAATEQTINFVIEGVPGNPTFEATLAEDQLQGTFTQGGASYPFTLAREDQTAETVDSANAAGETSGAATLSPGEALERLFTAKPVQADWFTDDFAAQVPVSQLSADLESLAGQLGPFQGLSGDSSPFTVNFARGTATVQVALDAQGRIAGLLLSDVVPNLSGADEAVAKLAALPGQTSLLVLKDGEEVASSNADTPLGVGSAFKLAVLAALQDQVAVGTHSLGRSRRTETRVEKLAERHLARLARRHAADLTNARNADDFGK